MDLISDLDLNFPVYPRVESWLSCCSLPWDVVRYFKLIFAGQGINLLCLELASLAQPQLIKYPSVSLSFQSWSDLQYTAMSLKSPLHSFQRHLGEEFSQLILEPYNIDAITFPEPATRPFSESMEGMRLSNSPLGWVGYKGRWWGLLTFRCQHLDKTLHLYHWEEEQDYEAEDKKLNLSCTVTLYKQFRVSHSPSHLENGKTLIFSKCLSCL